ILKAVLPVARHSIPRIADAGIDWRVLAFSVLATLATTVLFSVGPAIQLMRTNLTGALKEGAPTVARGHNGFRSALVVAQVTLGLVLVTGAEVLMTNFLHLTQQDPGFRPDHLLTFSVAMSGQANTRTEIAFSDRLRERLRAIPGVQMAAIGTP